MNVKRTLFLCLLPLMLSLPQIVAAQGSWTVSGRVADKKSGEALVGALVWTVANGVTIHNTVNKDGRYTLQLPPGDVTLEFFYTEYRKEQITVKYDRQNKQIDVALEPLTFVIPGVVVRGEKEDFRVRRTGMGIEQVTSKMGKTIPLLFGEPDIIKVIHTLPGVQAVSEGSSGYMVRGGGPDQNLVLFDQAAVYNPSHMLGFFSVFNNDAVGNVQLFKGDVPASHGGRLSSLLEIEGREGSSEYDVSGGIGLIASRLAISGPIGKSVTWLAAARRTYADMFLRLSNDSSINSAIIHFYDLNGKMRWRINDNNYLTFTIYNGDDAFGVSGVGFHFGNSTATLAWSHRFSSRLSLNASVMGTQYRYKFEGITSALEIRWLSNIRESGVRADFNYKWNEQSNTRFGWNGAYQWFRPGDATGIIIRDDKREEHPANMSHRQAMLQALYFSQEHRFFQERLNLRYGLRVTRFDNVGPTKQYTIDQDYQVVDTLWVPRGQFYHHEYGFEPRIALSYMYNDQMSIKASYSRTLQYVHLLSFSSAGSPLDIWIPANPAVKPQSAHQYSVGWFGGFFKNKLQASVELFYKDLNHVMDFKDHPNILLYDQVETEIRFGTGYAYGAEFMLKRETGNLTGWVSYTWLRSLRTISGVNNNKTYSAPSDRPHNVSVVFTYKPSFLQRLEASINWTYSTGQPFVMPEGRYLFMGEFVPIYSDRNAYRMPDYHRMDASLVWQLGRSKGKFKNDLNLSVYNLYGRKNPWMINYRLDPRTGSQYAEMTYLFSIVPSITWNFSF